MIWSILSIGIWLGIWGIFWSMWDRRAFAPAVLMAIGLISAVLVEVIS